MAFHHLAVATKDAVANDVFYERAMGFRLVKVEVGATPAGGWAKHLFYDTGSEGMIAFWEIHDEEIGSDYPTALSEGVGLPIWINHIAFAARDLADIEARKQRWLDSGYDVMEIDHHWCTSIYTTDPNGTLVEWCTTTAAFSDADRTHGARAAHGGVTDAGGAEEPEVPQGDARAAPPVARAKR